MQKIQVALLALAALIAGCASWPPPSAEAPGCPTCAPCPKCETAPVPVAVFSKAWRPADWSQLPGWADDDLGAAWPAFRESCKAFARRADGAPWRAACAAAEKTDGRSPAALRAFFERQFQPWAVTTGEGEADGLVTGYYEPLLRGSRQPRGAHRYPVLAVPDDLLTIDLGGVFPELKGKRVRGRLEGRKVLPYWTREEIAQRGEQLSAQPLLYVDDAVELFFLQVQGSGRVQLAEGGMARLNYADQNGHPYQSIGRVLVERGDLRLEQASMQGIQAWARAHPRQLNDLLNTNPSYVFFREVPNTDGGPMGALGVPLTPERSIAIDVRAVPLGAPVFLSTTRPLSEQSMNRLVMAQDTGGAIKGAVRADFFWGFGKEAGEQAGRMRQRGRVWVLLPPGLAPH